jgi:hypothetical protein
LGRAEPLKADPDGCYPRVRAAAHIVLVLVLTIVIGVRLQWRFG